MSSMTPKNRKAISAVLTTIIILVASIVLGTGVVIYSTSLFQSGGQQQSVQVQGIKTWVNSTDTTGTGWGAFSVKNTGDKILSVSSIGIRGVSIPFANWFADSNQTEVNSGSNLQANFNYTKNDGLGNLIGSAANGGSVTPALGPTAYCTATVRPSTQSGFTTIIIDTDGAGTNLPICLKQASGPVSLNPGQAAIIYYKLPTGLVSPNDAGVTETVSMLAGNTPIAQTVRIANPT
jgi:hypothetical protein